MIPPRPRAVHEMRYGTLHVGPYEAPWRRDTYTNRAGESFGESAMAASSGDVSPRHDKLDGYHPDCSCCWLGICHTEEKHARCLGVSDSATIRAVT